jgi:translation initiation factor IF-2
MVKPKKDKSETKKIKKAVIKPTIKKKTVKQAPHLDKRKAAKVELLKKKTASKKELHPPSLPKIERPLEPTVAGVNQIIGAIRPKKIPAQGKKVSHKEVPAVAARPEIIKPKEEAKKVTEKIIPQVKEVIQPTIISAPALKELELELPITVKDLAVKLQLKPSVLIKGLMDMKIMAGINQSLEQEIVENISQKYGYQIKNAPDAESLALGVHDQLDHPELLKPRPPIVTFMGHVDHGKTSLLDAIRKTKIAESEHGGITQHIGAYRVVLPTGEITFLDTPGHEAFTAMRSRGASITDIVVLVVAADDGVMPQTQEAIDHARAAGVPIIVAMNKIDKPQANIDRLKKQLAELDLTAEDWGGKTITVPVSAKTGVGIDDLLEMILLEAQMLELKANFQRPARGVVIEAKLSKGRGPVVTMLVRNGTLHLNENIIVGEYYGKIRAMFNDRGQAVTEVGPSSPVEVLGVSGVPEAGEQFFMISDEKKAKELALARQERQRQRQIKAVKRINLEDLHAQIEAGKIKELQLIIKADVQGSLEAIKNTLDKLNVSEIKLDIIHQGVGNINSSDVILAVASNALILGFNVTADELAKDLISKEGIDFRPYNIIYELANDIKAAIEGMLEPKIKKVFLGRAEVRKVFKLSKSGTVAGCFVTKGKITRNSLINLTRNGELVFEGKLSSLKRFKDDVREVAEGVECGMALGGFDNLKEGDLFEAYEVEKIARKL